MSRKQDFERFYREHYDAIFYYALRLVDDEEACRDIVGEALGQAWEKIDTINAQNLKNFVYTTVHHKCVDYMRRRMAANRYVDFCLQLYDIHVDENEWQEHEQLICTVVELLDSLTPRTRLVLELCYFRRMRYAEVAQELGISVNGVKKHIVTALKALRKEMQEKNRNY